MSTYRPTFVSHAHVDNDLCDRYVAALRARGIDTWYDRNDAQAGHFLGTDIQRELQQRTAFVLLMTQQALDSFWVQLELQAYLGLMAQDRSRMLLPVRIGPCQVPPFLNALFWVDVLALPFDKAVDAIAKALTTQSEPSAQPPVVAPSLSRNTPPPLGPAPTPANSTPALHLTPIQLYNLGFRGYNIGGVECILPPICPVPAGIFTMGGNTGARGAQDIYEKLKYPVDVGTFAIGRHPVTVTEYDCAVRAAAVREPPAVDRMNWRNQRLHFHHPVVCVQWKDALTYVQWLAKTTGQPWRLPSEAEWEKAARGTDGRKFPWGDNPDSTCCNTSESGIGTTTPVGIYPNGESPYHVQDMVGNVCQWTSSLTRRYPYRSDDGREKLDSTGPRMMRGGSWRRPLYLTGAAHRNSAFPENCGGDAGFRLAWGMAGLFGG